MLALTFGRHGDPAVDTFSKKQVRGDISHINIAAKIQFLRWKAVRVALAKFMRLIARHGHMNFLTSCTSKFPDGIQRPRQSWKLTFTQKNDVSVLAL